MQLKHKLALALACYGLIAILAWQTLTEAKLRGFVWIILFFFAFKSVLFWYRTTQTTTAVGGRDQQATERQAEPAAKAPSAMGNR
jgi:hypothetical protein